MTDAELLAQIKELGEYRDVRLLDDGSIIAIYMDVNQDGWGRRFCFQDKPLADKEFQRLSNEDMEPSGWIARR